MVEQIMNMAKTWASMTFTQLNDVQFRLAHLKVQPPQTLSLPLFMPYSEYFDLLFWFIIAPIIVGCRLVNEATIPARSSLKSESYV